MKSIANIHLLPFTYEIETKVVLKQVALAERALGQLKEIVKRVPNESVLINTLFLQEAKASSEVENIVTTQDEVFRSVIEDVSANTKEVQRYGKALLTGYHLVKHKRVLLNRDIKEIQSILQVNDAGFRTQKGTKLLNNRGETVYTPPQNAEDIKKLMQNLERFINNDELSDINPIIKMAIVHHQFESIHPFYDGNGRTGRIINVLYLSLKQLLDIPVLYLSRYIIDNKLQYYTLLQKVRDQKSWEEWVLFMIKGVEETAIQTTVLIQQIIDLMKKYKEGIRTDFPKIYSQDIVNAMFKHPYTKIDFLAEELQCSRQTAAVYLNNLVEGGYLRKHKHGRQNYFVNDAFCTIFFNARSI